MSYPRILHAVFTSPWAIQHSALGTIFSLLHSRVFAGDAPPPPAPGDGPQASYRHAQGATIRAARHTYDPTRGALTNHSARIHATASRRAESWAEYESIVAEQEAALPPGQLLHIFGSGIIGKHLSSMEETCAGGLSIDRIQAALKLARADDKISGVMLHLDTPGGICYGLPETAALVADLAATKTVGAYCDSLTASAGYGAICRADVIYITPSADVGSIGVYSAHVDYVEWCKKQGIEVRLFADGTYKGAGMPGIPLTEEQAAKIQADVMLCSAQFKNAVRAGRPRVTDDTMQGQCFIGQAALDAALADTLVNDLDAAMADLAATL